MTLPPGTPAGWYSDPSGAPMLRWWDGNAWTNDVTQMPSDQPTAPGGYAAPPPNAPNEPFPAPTPYQTSYAPGGYPTMAKTGTNGLAIASLVASIVGVCCGIGAIAGIIMGIVALNQLNEPSNQQDGKGLAIAGIAVGGVMIVLSIVLFASGVYF